MPQTAVQVDVAATKLLAGSRSHLQAIFFNNGPNSIFIGRRPDLATSGLGLPVPSNTGLKYTRDKGDDLERDWWATSSVLQVSPNDTRVEWS